MSERFSSSRPRLDTHITSTIRPQFWASKPLVGMDMHQLCADEMMRKRREEEFQKLFKSLMTILIKEMNLNLEKGENNVR